VTRTVYGKWLRDSRRSLLAWTVSIVVVGSAYAAFWPTFEDPEIARLLDSYPKALLQAINYTNITTPEGYLTATVYGLVVAVLTAIFAIAAGARLVAGDEEAGTLDLVLAHPVSRPSLALQRMAALTTAVVAVVGIFWLAMVLLSGPADFSRITVAHLAAMHVHLAAFALLFGSLSYAVGAATGHRAWALGAGAGAAVLAYAASGLLPQLGGLEWTRDWSAFTWLTGSMPLANGVDVGHLATMIGISAALVALGTLAFRRRDVAV
jgi:ABC-2 type transport system permease protein